MEISEDMRRRHGFAELGLADGPVKNAIFGDITRGSTIAAIRTAAFLPATS